ncbi:MAG: TonB-dependent receptor [Calditrichia bacterium]
MGSHNSLAQETATLGGKVIDAVTKIPLIGVNVEILNSPQGTATDESGEFRIENIPPGIKQIRFSYIGYETVVKSDVVVMMGRPAQILVEMQPTALQGEAVSVSAGYFVNDVQPQPSLIALNREEIRRQPGGFEDVVRTVAALPGVSINNAGGRNDLLVRGGGPAENLYVVNNIEVANINHFGTQGTASGSLSFINLDLVEDVTFSTGGFGAEYGDKMSAVLALRLGEGRTDRLGGKALISATQFGLDAEGPLPRNGNFIFSARKSYLDLIFKAAGLPFVPIYTDLNVLFNFQPTPRDRLFILGLGAIDQVDRDLSTAKNRVFNAGLMDNTQNQWIGGIDYRRSLSKGYFNITLNSNNYLYRFSQQDENLQTYFRSRASEQELGLKLQHFWALSPRLYVKSGISSRFLRNENSTSFADSIYDRNGRKIHRDQLSLPEQFRTDDRTSRQAIFQEWEWSGLSGLDLQLGIRVDYFRMLNKPWYAAPRFSVKYKLSPRLSLKTSSGLYYQSPSLVWLVNPFNRNLKALRNWMNVLGAEFYLRPDTRLSLEIYRKLYKNLPTGTVPGVNDHIIITSTGSGYGGREDDFQSFGYFNLVSRGHGQAYGAELYLQKKSSELPIYGQVSISYGRSEFVPLNGKTYPGPFDQRWIFNLTSGYIPGPKWQFGMRFRYFSGIPFTPVYHPSQNPLKPGFIQNLPEEYLSARLAAGHHLDVRVDRFFNFRSWTLILYLDVQNVYNYQIPIKPTYNFWEDKIIKSNAIGILPSIGVSANF